MLRRLFARGAPRQASGWAHQTIEVTDEGVTRTAGDRVESVRWDALAEVAILTTTDGPFGPDVFFVLFEMPESGCVIPHEFVPDELLSRLQSLPGFDNAKMIEAMGSTGDATFVCWRRDG